MTIREFWHFVICNADFFYTKIEEVAQFPEAGFPKDFLV
jgi:hypothetical protein